MTGSIVDIACELLRRDSSLSESELVDFRHEFSEAIFARKDPPSRLLEEQLEKMQQQIEELYSLVKRRQNAASDGERGRWLGVDR